MGPGGGGGGGMPSSTDPLTSLYVCPHRVHGARGGGGGGVCHLLQTLSPHSTSVLIGYMGPGGGGVCHLLQTLSPHSTSVLIGSMGPGGRCMPSSTYPLTSLYVCPHRVHGARGEVYAIFYRPSHLTLRLYLGYWPIRICLGQ